MDCRTRAIVTAGLGAGFMYFMDPETGKRRRARVRDQLTHASSSTIDTIDETARDFRNRAKGMRAEVRHIFSREKVDDRVLAERVRSEMGNVVSHPGSIEVSASNGHVSLSGVILADEVGPLIKSVKSVRGVRSVENRLEAHEEPGNIPGLQGQPSRPLTGNRFELMQANWSPSARFLAGLAGATTATLGLGRRDAYGAALSVVGAALLARALSNMELRRLTGVGAEHRAVDIKKTINVNAPIEHVYNLMSNYENYPKFMSNVREVTKIDDTRSHWVVKGPAGKDVEWDSVLTADVPNRKLAWKSESSSSLQHSGVIKFRSNPDGSTKVELRMTYNPVLGGIGHAVATVFGADPKTLLDDDLLRFKTMAETGIRPHDAARRTEEYRQGRQVH